jgi:nitronate monooxygenase
MKDVWGAGQGVGAVKEVVPVAQLVERLRKEYEEARKRLALAHLV